MIERATNPNPNPSGLLETNTPNVAELRLPEAGPAKGSPAEREAEAKKAMLEALYEQSKQAFQNHQSPEKQNERLVKIQDEEQRVRDDRRARRRRAGSDSTFEV